MPELSAQELQALSQAERPRAVTAEVVEEREYEMGAEDALLSELKSMRDTLRKSLVMLYFFDSYVGRITKRERTFMQQQEAQIELRLEEADVLIDQYSEEV